MHAAELIRSGECDALALPQWAAENALVMEANAPCDLRLLPEKIRTQVRAHGEGMPSRTPRRPHVHLNGVHLVHLGPWGHAHTQ